MQFRQAIADLPCPARRSWRGLRCLGIIAALAAASHAAAQEVSFRHEVMAVLSKAGCNQGVCHGNLHGKGGFKLSLRGEDPAADFATLVRGQFGRRINALRPEQSLILRKPTMAIAHEGGRRFAAGSREYEILRRWIAEGMRDDRAELPRLVRFEATPREAVLVEPQGEQALAPRLSSPTAAGRTSPS